MGHKSDQFDPDSFNQELRSILEEKQQVRNIDLLYRSLNQIHEFLYEKKEQAQMANDEKTVAYINGQIAGFKLATSTIEAFFDN